MSSGTVLFFENFHGHLAFEGRSIAAQASVHVLMFGASPANGFATWRGSIAQSGCLPFGSLLTNQRHTSATRHRLVGRPSQRRPAECRLSPSSLTRHFRSMRIVIAVQRLQMARGLSVGSREAKSFIATLPSRGRISANNVHRHATAGNQSCSGQTSFAVLRFACSQRPLLRAPA